MNSTKLKYIDINDTTQIAYYEAGEGNSEVTNLMIHGLAGSHEHYLPLINKLSENTHCIAIDLPGYGSSSKTVSPDQNVLDYFSEVIIEFIKAKKLTSVNLIGHSMGGQISIITVIEHPDFIKTLTLIDPAGFETFSNQEKAMLKATTTVDFYKNMTDEQIDMAFAMNFSTMPQSANALIAKRKAMRDEAGFEDYCSIISAGVAGMLDHEVRDKLSSITKPTLVIFAEEDKLIPNKYLHPDLTTQAIAQLATEIPQSELAMIPEAGHMVQYEDPLAVSNKILAFIKNN